jgi:molybdopterin/thiamine biosynthesis adenylyltransferase
MQRPCIKHDHLPVRVGEDLVQIGGSIPGIAGVIKDPDGWVWALLILLDGTRTVDRVVADLVHRFPHHPQADVREAIDDLWAAGHLYDAAESPPSALTWSQLERYSRAQALWQWMDLTPRVGSWEVPIALRNAKVAIVGVGGVGCIAALALATSGVGQVHLVDEDVVELSNLGRQILYTQTDIGTPKVTAAARRLRAHNSDVEITGEQLTIDGPTRLRRLADDCDILVMAADTPSEIRTWTNTACLAGGRPWVHSGYHGPLLSAGWFRPGTGPCYECARAETATPAITTGPRPAGPAMAAASAVSAGFAGLMAAHATMSLITGVPALPENGELWLNLCTWETSVVTAPEPGCPACG